MLPEEDEIKVKWIIKTNHGPLYYEQCLNDNASATEFELPHLFQDCIRITLQQYGFLRLLQWNPAWEYEFYLRVL